MLHVLNILKCHNHVCVCVFGGSWWDRERHQMGPSQITVINQPLTSLWVSGDKYSPPQRKQSGSPGPEINQQLLRPSMWLSLNDQFWFIIPVFRQVAQLVLRVTFFLQNLLHICVITMLLCNLYMTNQCVIVPLYMTWQLVHWNSWKEAFLIKINQLCSLPFSLFAARLFLAK